MTCADLTRTRDRDGGHAALQMLRRVPAALACWRRRAVERRQLAEMPPERWPDIARDPETIRREIAKPFWRA